MAKLQAAFCDAVERLGGISRASRISEIKRGRITYWFHERIPDWAEPAAMRVIELATNPKNHYRAAPTPRWKLHSRNDSPTTRRLERCG